MPPRLVQRVDRDVYQILRKFEDEHERYGNSKPLKFTISGVYNDIKKSNSSLSREKKKVLEDSIERVLRFRKDERAEDDDEDEAMEDTPAEPPTPKVCLLFIPLSSTVHLGF